MSNKWINRIKFKDLEVGKRFTWEQEKYYLSPNQFHIFTKVELHYHASGNHVNAKDQDIYDYYYLDDDEVTFI